MTGEGAFGSLDRLPGPVEVERCSTCSTTIVRDVANVPWPREVVSDASVVDDNLDQTSDVIMFFGRLSLEC